MATWDASFEASPADSDEAKYGANKIRELKTAISERLELELNFKAGTQPLIKAGQAAVCYYGNSTQISALSNVANGALAFNTTSNCFQRSNGTSYGNLAIDHGTLAGLSNDDHTQYLKLDKANQTISANVSVAANITIDGRDLSADGALVDTVANKSTIKFLANYVNLISWTAFANWTDVDVSANTGTDTAKAVLINMSATGLGSFGTAANQNVVGWARKNGSSANTNLPRVILRSRRGLNSMIQASCSGMFIVECDANEIFEVKFEDVENGNDYGTELTFKVDLIGYII